MIRLRGSVPPALYQWKHFLLQKDIIIIESSVMQPINLRRIVTRSVKFMETVLALRHSLSAPIWLKPRTIFFCAKALMGKAMAIEAVARAAIKTRRLCFISVSLYMVWDGNRHIARCCEPACSVKVGEWYVADVYISN